MKKIIIDYQITDSFKRSLTRKRIKALPECVAYINYDIDNSLISLFKDYINSVPIDILFNRFYEEKENLINIPPEFFLETSKFKSLIKNSMKSKDIIKYMRNRSKLDKLKNELFLDRHDFVSKILSPTPRFIDLLLMLLEEPMLSRSEIKKYHLSDSIQAKPKEVVNIKSFLTEGAS